MVVELQLAADIADCMREEDVAAFKRTARLRRLYILLRRPNPQSRKYIGHSERRPLPQHAVEVLHYAPKPLDCKAKTADRNALSPFGIKETAGLVINPHLFTRAFDTEKKWHDALRAWDGGDGQPGFRQFVGGALAAPPPGATGAPFDFGHKFAVQLDSSHKHYGCVMMSPHTSRHYLHGDYDLYGIVAPDDPTRNVRVVEQRHLQRHARGQELIDIQHYLNGQMGVPMIQHGSHEKYASHQPDVVYIFYPDGETVRKYDGRDAGAMAALYDALFQGRQTFGGGQATQPMRGAWERTR